MIIHLRIRATCWNVAAAVPGWTSQAVLQARYASEQNRYEGHSLDAPNVQRVSMCCGVSAKGIL